MIKLKNKKVIKKILHEISFGGVGSSGIGSYHSKAGFDTFTHYKSILHKSFLFEPNIKYLPFTKLKSKILEFLLE
jgi:aldehyde dehydrogenase (NAD+)